MFMVSFFHGGGATSTPSPPQSRGRGGGQLPPTSGTLSLIRWNMHSCDRDVKIQAYSTLVRLKFEYASRAWLPYTANNIKRLEAIQKSAARFRMQNYQRRQCVTALKDELKWDTLKARRLLNDAVMFHKIQEKLVRIPSKYFTCYARYKHKLTHKHKE